LIATQDGKILDKEIEKTKAAIEAQSSYCKELRTLAKSVRSKVGKGTVSKASSSSSSSSKATPSIEPATRIPKKLPEGDHFDEALAQSMLPPNYAVYKDFFNNRWIVHYKGAVSWNCSRSWSLYGSRNAVLLVCQAAWSRHTATTGEVCPCQGLLEAKAQ
jgi:hypothetical protein